MPRYLCEKCGTTMDDIERLNIEKFCVKCRLVAKDYWVFAVAVIDHSRAFRKAGITGADYLEAQLNHAGPLSIWR